MDKDTAEKKTKSRYAKARRAFGVVFVVSASLTVALFFVSFSSKSSAPYSISPSADQNTSSNSAPQQPTTASNISQDQTSSNNSAPIATPTQSGIATGNKSTGNLKSSNNSYPTTTGNYNSNNTIARQTTPRNYPSTPGINVSPNTNPPRLFASNITFLALAVMSLLFLTVVSLLGFFLMAILAWRRERGEKENLNIENQRKAQEVERLRFELKKSRQAANNSEVKQCPTCKKIYSDNSLRFCIDDGATLSQSFNPAKTASNNSKESLNLEEETPTQWRQPR